MKEIINELIDKKQRLKEEIERRGVDMSAATLADYGEKIREIGSGSLYVTPLTQLGYSREDEEFYSDLDFGTLGEMCRDFAYSMSVKPDSEPIDTYRAYFMDDTRLKYAPYIPSGSQVDDFSDMFRGCENLVTVPSIDLSLATNIAGMFRDCKSLGNPVTDGLCLWNVTNMSGTFENCAGITKLDLSGVDLSNVEDMSYCFYNCGALDVLTLNGFGACECLDAECVFDFCDTLGASAEGLEALRGTLITDSFDRAAAGYSALTITLPSAVKARLTEDELARITAKGFTIA
jgi:surface protein